MTEDLLFLGAGGFLVGSFLCTGWYTTRYEPEAKPGYIVMGIGIILVVVLNTILEFRVESSNWYLAGTLVGYAIIAIGLALVVRERRKRE